MCFEVESSRCLTPPDRTTLTDMLSCPWPDRAEYRPAPLPYMTDNRSLGCSSRHALRSRPFYRLGWGSGLLVSFSPRLKACARILVDLFNDLRMALVRGEPPQKVGNYGILKLAFQAVISKPAILAAKNRPDFASAMWSCLGCHVCIIPKGFCIVKKKSKSWYLRAP